MYIMNINGYQQYKQQSISTMTNGEMLILLYDESIKRLAMAQFALDKQDYAQFEDCIERTEKIIRYLSSILDRKYAISSDLYRLYDYFLFQLGRIRAGRNKEILKDLKQKIGEIRDTFKEADKISS